eukprot:112943-Prorocentrum_minimum.AAC.1
MLPEQLQIAEPAQIPPRVPGRGGGVQVERLQIAESAARIAESAARLQRPIRNRERSRVR